MSLQADNFILQCSRAMANGGDLSFEFFQDADGLPAQIGELSENGAQAKAAHVRQVRERSSRAPQRALAYVLGRDDALTKRHLSSSFSPQLWQFVGDLIRSARSFSARNSVAGSPVQCGHLSLRCG